MGERRKDGIYETDAIKVVRDENKRNNENWVSEREREEVREWQKKRYFTAAGNIAEIKKKGERE